MIQVMGSGARPALPALMEALQRGDATLQAVIVQALREIGPDAATTVPVVIPLLKAKHLRIRVMAVELLGRIGEASEEGSRTANTARRHAPALTEVSGKYIVRTAVFVGVPASVGLDESGPAEPGA